VFRNRFTPITIENDSPRAVTLLTRQRDALTDLRSLLWRPVQEHRDYQNDDSNQYDSADDALFQCSIHAPNHGRPKTGDGCEL
jgi:hypothetical protein